MIRTKTSKIYDQIAPLQKGSSLTFRWTKSKTPHRDILRYTYKSNWIGRSKSKRAKEFIGKRFSIQCISGNKYNITRVK